MKYRKDHLKYFVFVTLVFVFFSTVLYVFNVKSGYPKGDHWRWIKDSLIPYSKGDIGFWKYLMAEYGFLSHNHFTALILMVFSFKFFHLNFFMQWYLGFFFYILTVCLFLNLSRKYCLDQDHEYSNILLFASILIIYLNISQNFSWFLIMIECIYFAHAIILFMLLDRYVKDELSSTLYFTFLSFVFVFTDGIGFLAIISSMLVLVLATLFERKYLCKALSHLFVISSLLILQWILLGLGKKSERESIVATIKYGFSDLEGFLRAVFNPFSQSVVDAGTLKYFLGVSGSYWLRMSLGGVLCALVCVLFFLYWKHNLYRKSFIPVLLIVYSALAWCSIFVMRFVDLGPDTFLSPRYIRHFSLLAIGGVLIYVLLKPKRYRLQVSITIFMFALVSYTGSAAYKWKFIEASHKYHDKSIYLIKNSTANSEELGRHMRRCANGFCESSIEFMKDNELNVFYIDRDQD